MARNTQVLREWEELLRTRREAAIVCWEHIASAPLEPLGGRYVRLKGSLATCEYQGAKLPQWQWEIDRRAPVKVAIGKGEVVIMSVSTGHPKENE